MTIDGPTGPRIDVASLLDYTAGRLHGTWLEATDDLDDLTAQTAKSTLVFLPVRYDGALLDELRSRLGPSA